MISFTILYSLLYFSFSISHAASDHQFSSLCYWSINLFRRGKKDPKGIKNHTKALRVLGLDQTSTDKNKEVKVVNVKQFSEREILLAFQNKCDELGNQCTFK